MEDVAKGLGLLLEFENIALILAGVLIGVLVGALPGLSSPMAIALLIPYNFFRSCGSYIYDGCFILRRYFWWIDYSYFN